MVRLSNQFLEDLEKLASIYRDQHIDNVLVVENDDHDYYNYQNQLQKEITTKKRGQRLQ